MEHRAITTPDLRLHYVRLTNRLDVPFTDMYDGVPVEILPGKSDNFPIDMAAHFFGDVTNRDAMFRHICRRQGWNTPAHLKPAESDAKKTVAEVLFAGLDVQPVVYKMVEEQPTDLDGPIPADPQPPEIDDGSEQQPQKPPRPVLKRRPGY